MENFKEAKKAIGKAKSIAILPSPDFRKDVFPASLALFYSLKDLGKNVNLKIRDYPEKFNFLVGEDKSLSSISDFLVSIKDDKARVKQVFYEKTNKALNFYLKTNGEELKKEDVLLKSLEDEELLITLGIARKKEVSRITGKKQKLTVNIDNQLKNEDYADINLIEVSSPSLSEIVFDLLGYLGEKLITKKISDLLLSEIVSGTSSFQDPKLNPQTFQKASSLMKKGADATNIVSRICPSADQAALRIFGRILSKIDFSDSKTFSWALLEKEDFLETKSVPSDLKFSLEKLSSGTFPFQSWSVLWQSRSSSPFIRGIVYSPIRKIIEKTSEKFGGERKGNGILFGVKSQDIKKVKQEISKITKLCQKELLVK